MARCSCSGATALLSSGPWRGCATGWSVSGSSTSTCMPISTSPRASSTGPWTGWASRTCWTSTEPRASSPGSGPRGRCSATTSSSSSASSPAPSGSRRRSLSVVCRWSTSTRSPRTPRVPPSRRCGRSTDATRWPCTSTSTSCTSSTRRSPRTPNREGVTLEVAATALRRLTADPRFRALTVTEFNPLHGAADGSTTRRLVEVLARALS